MANSNKITIKTRFTQFTINIADILYAKLYTEPYTEYVLNETDAEKFYTEVTNETEVIIIFFKFNNQEIKIDKRAFIEKEEFDKIKRIICK